MPWNFTKKETVYLYLSPMIKLSIRVIYVCSVNEQCHQISLIPDTVCINDCRSQILTDKIKT